MRTIDTTGDLKLTDGTFRITGSAGSLYRLQNLATGAHSSEHISDILPRLTEVPEWPAICPGDLQVLQPQDRSETVAMAEHIEEMVTGVRPGYDVPRPQYDPATTSQNERVLSKAAELNDRGLKASRASLYKKKTLWLQGGAAGLIDHRKLRSTDRFGRADQDVLDVIAYVIAKFHKMSTVTETRLHHAVLQELNLRFPGKGNDMCPSRATLYRYFALLGRAQHVTGKATTRRSAGLVPKRRNVTVHRVLPGEEVQVDSTWADIMVTVPGYDKPQRPRITIMIDKATRSIIASTIRLVAANGYDHALLLAQALTPYEARPNRSTHRALLTARHPGINLLSSAERTKLERSRPYIFPRRIVSDNGKDFLSPVFTSACRKYQIDITLSAVVTPTDKPIVERNFGVMNELFFQYLPGYVGTGVGDRGENVEGEELLDINVLAEMFDDWVVNVWQNRPHGGLRDPFEPTVKYSPNQAYNAAAAYAGSIAIPLTTDEYIDLLPIEYRVIGKTGIQIDNRIYDCDELNDYRGKPSHSAAHGNDWEVRYNPYDVMHVWVRTPDGEWIECPWRETESIAKPMFAEVAANRRKEARNDLARQEANLTGTPMPVGTPVKEPEPELAYNFTPAQLTADINNWGLADPNEE